MNTEQILKEEAQTWKDRYYALKRWVESNSDTWEKPVSAEWKHPWWETVDKVSQGHQRKDMDLL
tara:strand:+ start:5386 stop:5577 length:192 start_codon:yes stop_codon:yes gene_type:complete